jgi:hypothetical protein
VSALKGSTQFTVSLHYAPEYSIKRFDYSIATPGGVVSVPKEFANVNGAGVEFLHQFISSEKDDHDDMMIAYTRDSVTNPTSPSIRLYTFQKQCNYLKHNGAHPICFDCFSDEKIALSGLANCMQVPSVRFFTYTVTQDASKADDSVNFHGILTLENFDVNTDVVANLQIWLQTNMVLNPTLAAFSPTIIFQAVPINRIPTNDNKIPLPFKIQLATGLTSDQTVQITFSLSSIINNSPTFMNMAQMIT